MTSQNIPKDAHLQTDSEEPDSEREVLGKDLLPFVLFTLSILYMHNSNVR